MRRFVRPCRLAWSVALLLLASRPCSGQTPVTPGGIEPFGITDNSFLVEEAFNQEAGIFQNIFNLRLYRHQWIASFTQEWPAPGIRHQLSYTLPLGKLDDGTGVGDVLINYRLQVTSEGSRTPAFAPRLSVILPTASTKTGLGTGVVGWQMALPFSKRAGNLYFHWNAGLTYLTAHTPESSANEPSALNTLIAGSGIWRASSTLNLLFEAVLESFEESDAAGSRRTHDLTLSPGLRKAWNRGDKQIVAGLAVPVVVDGDGARRSVFGYFSYELPFKK
jgi:hypothetical protein